MKKQYISCYTMTDTVVASFTPQATICQFVYLLIKKNSFCFGEEHLI